MAGRLFYPFWALCLILQIYFGTPSFAMSEDDEKNNGANPHQSPAKKNEAPNTAIAGSPIEFTYLDPIDDTIHFARAFHTNKVIRNPKIR